MQCRLPKQGDVAIQLGRAADAPGERLPRESSNGVLASARHAVVPLAAKVEAPEEDFSGSPRRNRYRRVVSRTRTVQYVGSRADVPFRPYRARAFARRFLPGNSQGPARPRSLRTSSTRSCPRGRAPNVPLGRWAEAERALSSKEKACAGSCLRERAIRRPRPNLSSLVNPSFKPWPAADP